MPGWTDAFTAEAAPQILGYLLDLSLKGLLILSLAGIVTALLRRAPAATRHLVWCLALCSLVALPVLGWLAPAWHVGLLPSQPFSAVSAPAEATPAQPAAPAPPAAPTPPAAPEPAVAPVAPSAEEAEAPTVAVAGGLAAEVRAFFRAFDPLRQALDGMHWTGWLMLAWLAGALVILAQLVAGAVGVWRLSRTARPVQESEWLDLADEVGDRLFLTRPVRLVRSTRTATPMTWGFFRPVVLLPADAEAWTEERRRCVLTHEFAHIQRWDCLTQMVAQIACAVFWFNPLVWIALRHVRTEREKACDDYVLAYGTRPSDYATHLIDIARTVRDSFASPLGAVAMAKPSQLEGRVLAILDAERTRRALDRRTAALTACVAALLVLPLGAMRPWPPAERQSSYQPALAATPAPAASPEATPAAEAVAEAAATPNARVRVLIEALSDPDAGVREQAARALGEIGDPSAADALAKATRDESAGVRRMATRALGELPDHASHAREPRQATDGPRPDQRPSPVNRSGRTDELEARAAVIGRAAGAAGVEIGQNVLRALGGVVAIEGIRLDANGDGDVDEAELEAAVARQIHGVTEEDVRAFRALGLGNLDSDDLVAAKIHGVDAPFVRAVRSRGFDPSLDDLIGMRVMGVDLAFIDEMVAAGFRDLSLDELVQLRTFGVDRAFVESLRAAGLKKPTVDQVVELRILNVIPRED